MCRSASRLAINCDVNCSFHKAQTSFRVSCAKPSDFLLLKGTNLLNEN